MSRADNIFIYNATRLIHSGRFTKATRAKWTDGTPANTYKVFGVVNSYDLRDEFPAITLRKTNIKGAFDELLWIYQKKSNNVKDLKTHIWDQWADPEGSIGEAYGAQVRKRHVVDEYTEILDFDEKVPDYTFPDDKEIKEKYHYDAGKVIKNVNISSEKDINGKRKLVRVVDYKLMMDQIDAVIYQLTHNPFSRRILIDLWNFNEIHLMSLTPCCWSCNFNVTDDGGDKLVLNMVLNQRSGDFLTANNWNVVQYALLMKMLAQVCDMEAGVLLHIITDLHVYDRHLDIVKELITRKQHLAPTVELNPEIKDFYQFTVNDLTVKNYCAGNPVKFEVAI